jgi:HK97 gp10 family phage protein
VAEDDVKGLTELAKLLDKLPPRIQRNVLRGAVKAGADMLVGPMQAAAPVWSGRLEESVLAAKETSAATRRRKRRGRREMNPGANRGLEVSAGIAFAKPGKRYWHFSEFGTVKQAAKPWIRPTFAANQGRVLAAMKTYISKRLEREARKLAKETGAKK